MKNYNYFFDNYINSCKIIQKKIENRIPLVFGKNYLSPILYNYYITNQNSKFCYLVAGFNMEKKKLNINAIKLSNNIIFNSIFSKKFVEKNINLSIANKNIYIYNTSKLIDHSLFNNCIKSYDICFSVSMHNRTIKNCEYIFKLLSNIKLKKYKKIIIGNNYNLYSKKYNIENVVYKNAVIHSKNLEYISSSKVILIPSLFDASPNILYEALYLNTKPIVSQNVGIDSNVKKFVDCCNINNINLWINTIIKNINNKFIFTKKNEYFSNKNIHSLIKKMHLSKIYKTYNIAIIYDIDGWIWNKKSLIIKNKLSKYFNIKLFSYNTYKNISENEFHLIVTFEPLKERKHEFPFNNSKMLYGLTTNIDRYNNNIQKNIKKKIFKNNCFGNSFIICNNLKKYNAKEVFYAPNGVEIEKFRYTLNKNIIKTKKKLTIGWIGRDTCKSKRFDIFLNIKKNLINNYNYNNDNFIAITNSSKNKLSHDQIIIKFKQIDILLITSEFEGTPNPGLEAAASNTLIISTKVGNMVELINNKINGFLINNYKEIIPIIKNMNNNRELYIQMVNNMNNSIEKYNWSNTVYFYKNMFIKTILSTNI